MGHALEGTRLCASAQPPQGTPDEPPPLLPLLPHPPPTLPTQPVFRYNEVWVLRRRRPRSAEADPSALPDTDAGAEDAPQDDPADRDEPEVRRAALACAALCRAAAC
jgi:hypothetical protein